MERFAEKSDLQTVALEVEGVKLWVCPEQLACHSQVLKNLFFGDYREKHQETIVMEGKSLDTFVPFLTCLSEAGASFRPSEEVLKSYLGILKLADEYQADSLKKNVEGYILSEVIPKLDVKKDGDKKELMKILICASELEPRADVFGAAYKRVLSLDVKFLMCYRGKVDPEVFQDLLEGKLLGCVSYMAAHCPSQYQHVPLKERGLLCCKNCWGTYVNGQKCSDHGKEPERCARCGKDKDPTEADSCICCCK